MVSPRCLFGIIPTAKRAYIKSSDDKLPHLKVKQLFQKFFLPFDCGRME